MGQNLFSQFPLKNLRVWEILCRWHLLKCIGSSTAYFVNHHWTLALVSDISKKKHSLTDLFKKSQNAMLFWGVSQEKVRIFGFVMVWNHEKRSLWEALPGRSRPALRPARPTHMGAKMPKTPPKSLKMTPPCHIFTKIPYIIYFLVNISMVLCKFNAISAAWYK